MDAEALNHEIAQVPLPPEGTSVARVGDVVKRVLSMPEGRIHLVGTHGCANAWAASALLRAGLKQIVLVTTDTDAARKVADEILFLSGLASAQVAVIPAPEQSPYAAVSPDRQIALRRMSALFALQAGGVRAVVLSAAALTRKVVPASVVKDASIVLTVEEECAREELIRVLNEGGYLRVPVVEDPGSYAIRGAIIDVWPGATDVPYRVEFYGDLVLSIKPFDPFEQRTKEADVRSLALAPVREGILSEENRKRARTRVLDITDALDWPTTKSRALVEDVTEGRSFFGADGWTPALYESVSPIASYFERDAVFVLDAAPATLLAMREEIARTIDDAERAEQEPHLPSDSFIVSELEIQTLLGSRRVLSTDRTRVLGAEADPFLAFGDATVDGFDLFAHDLSDLTRAVKAGRSTKGKSVGLRPLATRIAAWRDHALRVTLVARTETQADRIALLLQHQGLACTKRASWADALAQPTGERVALVVGSLAHGVILIQEGHVLVTEEEIFGARAAARRSNASRNDKSRPFLEDLRSLNVGDYVIHVEHGIGKYLGLVHKAVGTLTVDLLVVEYSGGDKLYLPVYRLQQIQKYQGGENASPRIDRLGGSTFSKTKSRVRGEVRKMADELLRLYAERRAQRGVALPPADDDFRTFEATFPFEETPDQARAISDVNKDLESDHPMDRIVCGDVGFGKTEVAIRAAFRVALAGKQVALLCPTTVLAQQHFRTLEARFRDVPVRIAAMSRFQSKKEIDESITKLKDGSLDIVVGTHRLLSKDIHFKDLGLLIVDEEQRFGVANKERIKQIRTSVDVLTLTATPIPRTLQMAVTGVRDLSLITTPPVDRRAVRTIVTRFDDQVIREAVKRELGRGGQIFYVYNRIDKLYEKAQRLAELVPEARIAVAHGQMTKGGSARETGVLEEVMLDFVEGRYDILVATAIVESGLDIPRANTILIDRADLFGLAQLYQLRGRVGRSKERAYCYLIVPPQEAMTDEARARIEALERHTELGSGFQIASMDLELRGAGDLLGAEQSGSMATVGFDLFCQMLDEAVQELKGETVVHEVDPELSFDVTALLPEEYVTDVGVRLSLYKRFAGAIDEAEVSELALEMEDRFGAPPEEAKQFVKLMMLKTELRTLRVLGCEASKSSVTLHLRDDTPLDPKKVLELVKRPKSPYRLTPDMRLSCRFLGETDGVQNTEALLHELASCLA